MNEIIEIAYAAVLGRLCLFTGTGFSKAVTNDKAYSWSGLLKKLCDKQEMEEVKEAIFSDEEKGVSLSLEEKAQIIAIELANKGRSIHEEIAKMIKQIKLNGDYDEIEKYFKKRLNVNIVTTNYDQLIEKIADNGYHSVYSGNPIPRSNALIQVYHLHGSVDKPENMIVTSDDYFSFINQESYFSRKLSTILHENIIVILGYSLGDNNLKAILNDYKKFSRDHSIISNIILISRAPISQYIKDYYFQCYQIRVIDNLKINDFFCKLNQEIEVVKENNQPELSVAEIIKVLNKEKNYPDDFLKKKYSFFEILSSIGSIGTSLNRCEVVELIGNVIQQKKDLTQSLYAWDQYDHLSSWLIYLAKILEIKGTSLEKIFLEAVSFSMTHMGERAYQIGVSWRSFLIWREGWSSIIASNRTLIKEYIQNAYEKTDGKQEFSSALKIITQK